MKPFNFLALVVLVISFSSCKKIFHIPDCEEPLYITNSSIVVTFKDSASKQYLYSETHPLYNKDSLKIYNPLGEPLTLLTARNFDTTISDGFFVIDFGSLFDNRTDSASFSHEICKDFTVQYSYNKRDTIKTCFKSKDEKCGSVFSTLKVYHKGKLLASEYNTTGTLITIIKN